MNGADAMTNEELAVLIEEGDNEAVALLWENMKKLFYRINFRYAAVYHNRMAECGVTVEDLHQECYFVMLESVRAYNARKPEHADYLLTTYVRLIYKKHFQKILSIHGRGRPKDVLNMHYDKLDETVYDDSDSVLMDFIPDDTAEEEYRNIENADYCSKAVETAKNLVSEKQWRILARVYINGQPQKAVADEIGVSTTRIQEIACSALKTLRSSEELREIAEINEYQHIGVKGCIKGGSIEERIAEFKEHRCGLTCRDINNYEKK